MKASVITSLLSVALVAAECPAPGSTDSQGRYSCSPAHQYPNGQTCGTIDGCPYLLGPDGKPVNNSPGAACPAPGSTDSQGRYSCSPAHQYPNGQTCGTIDGCPYLLGPDGKPVNNSPGAACPAPGSTDSQGRYSCSPAHQYPNGQTCGIIDGCPYLLGPDGKPVNNSPTSSAKPTQTAAVCPAPGSTDSQGRYSCSPAHQYPNGQTCGIIDGCPYLLGPDGKPVNNAPTTGAAQPTQTAVTCPAPGSTDSQGRYSCNPAHQYPNGQTCSVIDGCYYLCSGGKPVVNVPTNTASNAPTKTGTTTSPTAVVTAGAATLQAAGALAMAAFGLLL